MEQKFKMAAFLRTHPAEEEEPAVGVVPDTRYDDRYGSRKDGEGKPGTGWNHLINTVPKWTYGTTGPQQNHPTGTVGPYRH